MYFFCSVGCCFFFFTVFLGVLLQFSWRGYTVFCSYLSKMELCNYSMPVLLFFIYIFLFFFPKWKETLWLCLNSGLSHALLSVLAVFGLVSALTCSQVTQLGALGVQSLHHLLNLFCLCRHYNSPSLCSSCPSSFLKMCNSFSKNSRTPCNVGNY